MAQSPPQSARSGQCNARSRPANCRRNSSSASGPAGGRSHQGAVGSAAPPAVHPALHAPWPAPSTAVPSSRRSRAPRAVSSVASREHSALKSAHAGPRDSPSRRASYLRRGARQCESLCDRVPRLVRPSRTPRPHHRILYPSVSRSLATTAPSMATQSSDPMCAPPSARDRLRPLLPLPPTRRYPITFSCEGASVLLLVWLRTTRALRVICPVL